MQAIIMAGGQGSRLRPLTCDIPKPMVPLCGRPILEYIMDWLLLHKVTHSTLTLGYLPTVIQDHFPAQQYGDMQLRFVIEDSPLGTAGGVKQAAENMTDDFLVVSGDALCDFNLTEAYQYHIQSKADVTLVATRVRDPREYGLVQCDDNGTVQGFCEKPSWSGVTSHLANTGIYVIHPRVLKEIPLETPFDFANDLFPMLMKNGFVLKTFVSKGYWCDIGDLNSYRQCQFDMLAGKVKHIAVEQPAIQPNYQLISPVYLGKQVKIGDGSVVGPNVVIDDGCQIATHARIRDSVLLSNCFVGTGSRITGGILAENVSLGKQTCLYEQTVLGTGAVVEDYAEIMPNISVWPKKTVGKTVRLKHHLKIGNTKNEYFDDSGLCGEIGVQITPFFCARLGCAVGSLKGVQRIGIGFDDNNAAKAMYHGVLSGLASTGIQVWDFGCVTAAQMQFASSFCNMSVSIFITGNNKGTVVFYDRFGLPCDRGVEREIASRMERDQFVRCEKEDIRDIAQMNSFSLVYHEALQQCLPKGLRGVTANLRCENKEKERIFRDIFVRSGGTAGRLPSFLVSQDGTMVTATDEKGKELSRYELLAIGCYILCEQGECYAVSQDAPLWLERLGSFGGICVRWGTDNDTQARTLAKNQYWLRDGMMLTFHILDYMNEHQITLRQLATKIPSVSLYTVNVPIRETPTVVMERIRPLTKSAGLGVVLTANGGIVRVWPSKNGHSLHLLAEAVNEETAQELCAGLQEKIAELLDSNEKV